MLAHIVTSANRSSYAAALEEMHRQRHQVFVQTKGWRDLRPLDGEERDEFDADDATYILVLNDVGDLEASLRLIPSHRPHMLEVLAASWRIRDVPVDYGTWEWSRYLPGRRGASHGRLVESRAVLITGALEFARSRSITMFTACCDVKRFNMFPELGWEMQFLSDVVDYGQGRAAAIAWRVSQRELDYARAHFGLSRPVTVEMPPQIRTSRLHHLHYAAMAELWEMDCEEKLAGALIAISQNAIAPPPMDDRISVASAIARASVEGTA